ncbi:DUF2927 domain-containing protein [Rhodobacteraceae bacterium CCMM004]|nr:DUF2927 domain-containing protein [Rhodobacteraceae bacterium CCMM004]
MGRRITWIGAATFTALLTAGCETPAPVEPSPRPIERPERPASSPKPSERPAVRQSEASLELQRYYARVQEGLLAQGLLRRDGGGPDTPFDARILVQNFVRIALFEEYADQGGRLVARETASRLHRWDRPVTIDMEFGASVDPAKVARDRNAIIAYTRRLARVSRHPISTVRSGGNFTVFVVNEDERRALGPRLRRMIPGISAAALDTVVNLPRSSYCLVFALDPKDTGDYSRAVAIIRGEHPDLLRLSCIHEELAQGLGLANDSPAARPSVFNDDEEFGLLTTHDEHLLRILYDPRLRPGMTAPEALPIVQVIAGEIMGGPS